MLVSRHNRLPRRKLLLFLGDAFFTAVAMHASIFLRLGWEGGLAYLAKHEFSTLLAWVVFLGSFYLCGLYEPTRLNNLRRTVASSLLAVLLGSLLVTAVFYITMTPEQIGRGIFIGFSGFVLVGLLCVRWFYISATSRGFMGQRCLIIGTSDEARKVIRLLEDHSHAGIKILGLIHCDVKSNSVGKFVLEYPVLGGLDSLEKFVDLYGIDRLILAASVDFEPVLLRRLRSFRYRGITLVDFVTLYEELAQEIPLDHIDDEWLFMASMDHSQFHVRRLKRLGDIVAASVGLLLSLPLSVLAVILIRLTSRGPVVYSQERLGRDSVPFTLYKFRTMRVDAETESGPVWSMDDDPRITWVGKWLRKFRVDEIPQLWNILRGDMSLVGPRPERPVFIKKLSEMVPFYAERLLVTPGLTGWAQVMHPYTASIEESRRKLQFDLFYIKHMSFMLDVYIMLKTVKTICFGRERQKPSKQPAANPTAEITTELYQFPPAAPADQTATTNPSVAAPPRSGSGS